MADREQTVIDLLCGELQTSWSYCDPSCISCKFYHEESDMGARVSICVHGFGSSKESCGYYMTQREYLEFVRSGFTNLKAENAKLREFVTEIMHYAKYSNPDCGLCKYYNECWADDALNLPTGCIICNEARELGIEVKS